MADTSAVAVIAAAGRFPGAQTVREFWSNVGSGVDVSVTLNDERLVTDGFDPTDIGSGAVVGRRYLLPDADLFDHRLFGYAPAEADIIDPQQRLGLEVVWELFESAGYDPARFDGAIGAFAASGFNSYLLANVARNQTKLHEIGLMSAMLGNTKDFLTTRLAYHFDLRGPAVTVGTGCSSGAVAVHMAMQSLYSAESDMAVAGGVTVSFPQTGYAYREGGTNSPDGYCRPFDARAAGTAPGDAAAFVLLKRLDDALADGDEVLGVLLGSAVNNDGSNKVGFTAPGLDGQVAVISEAIQIAEVDPGDIDYIEAHGTGTPLGDAIELQALAEAFESQAPGQHWIGSVKSCVGHTDTAAGIVGLINILGAYDSERIPATRHFERPNPSADFDTTGFRVAERGIDWPAGARRRIAGMSSFGIGGTNAHIIVADHPRAPESIAEDPQRWQVARLSAADPGALGAGRRNLAHWLREHPEVDIARVCRTLAVGRRELPHRTAVTARSATELAAALDGAAQELTPPTAPALGFLFPGQGAQYAQMGAGLYRTEPLFRRTVDDCCALLADQTGLDLTAALHDRHRAAELLADTRYTQPALFVIEYATTLLLGEWGVHPHAVLGHSLGELVAATVAGAMSWQTGCELAAIRGRLMARAAAGATAVVGGDARTVAALIDDSGQKNIAVAAINAPDQTLISGAVDSLVAVTDALSRRGVRVTRLPGTVAVHSPLMDPVLDEFRDRAAQLSFARPALPLVSGMTGSWLTPEAVTDGAYWAEQVRATVQYQQAFDTLRERYPLLIEIGPSSTLRGIAAARGVGRDVITTLGRTAAAGGDAAETARAAARLWRRGVPVARPEVVTGPVPRRIGLPTYAFQRSRHWIDATDGPTAPGAAPTATAIADPVAEEAALPPEHRLVVAAWREVLGVAEVPEAADFYDLGGHSLLAANLRAILRRAGADVSVADLMADPTVAGMAAVAASALSGPAPDQADTAAAMRADIATVTPHHRTASPVHPSAVRQVLLTGATGFVGTFLLAELLRQGAHRVLCPVRADSDDQAAEKIRRSLDRHLLWRDEFADRIDAVAADIESPGLGLDAARYRETAESSDLIVHNAARVDVTASYRTLRQTNVVGTRSVFDLAVAGSRVTPVLHMSTSGVVVASDDDGRPLAENRRLRAEQVLPLGYPQSKWVAEQIALQARAQGVPVAVVRPHRISPDTTTGRGAYNDAMWAIIASCVELGRVPVPDPPASAAVGINFVPVDYVAPAVVRLGLTLATGGLTDIPEPNFHLANPVDTTLDDIFATARTEGHQLTEIPWAQWVELLTEAGTGADASTALRTAATVLGAGDRSPDLGSIRLDCANARRVLEPAGVVCPPIDTAVVSRYLAQLIPAGTHAPRGRNDR